MWQIYPITRASSAHVADFSQIVVTFLRAPELFQICSICCQKSTADTCSLSSK